MSETEAADVFLRIRTGGDVQEILNHVKEGSLLMQLSLVPETRRRYELPHVPNMPAFTLVPNNAYLSSLVYETTFPTFGAPEINNALSLPTRDVLGDNDAYLKPYHSATMTDPLLQRIKPSIWTTVSTDNELLRRLLGAYFMHQHLSHFYFNKDLFLEDMATGGEDHCSQLLVNAVLAAGCHSLSQLPDRFKFWLPHNLGYRFTTEAKRLWELETLRGKDRITTVHAACVLNNITDLNGTDVRNLIVRSADQT